MSYKVRNKEGFLKFVLSNYLTNQVMNSVRGEFQEKTFVNLGKKTVFLITQDIVMDVAGASLYFWKGDYLEKMEDTR